MKFTHGETVLLGNHYYLIQRPLGSGAVADVYLAGLSERPQAEVVVKLARDDLGQEALQVAGLRQEVAVLTTLNQSEDPSWGSLGLLDRLDRAAATTLQRRVVALLDSGEMAANQPFLIQEMAPPAFERFDLTGPADEQRVLTVLQAVAEVIALAHRHNLALKDFEPRTKWDRLRLRWLDEKRERFELKVIDWNISGDAVEMAQDLLFWGGHLYYFLLGGQVLDVNDQPPVNLGLGAPGWEQLTTGTRQLLRRLLHRDPRRRYQQVAALLDDLTWWVDTLGQADGPLARLEDRLWQARSQNRSDRALAVTDLALRRPDLSTEASQTMRMWADQADKELSKEIWQPLAYARATLLTGAYEKAAKEFAEQIAVLPAESEVARLARLYHYLALAGDQLKQHQGTDIRSSPEWVALGRVVEALAPEPLAERRWDEARTALRQVWATWPVAQEWPGLKDLAGLAEAGRRLTDAMTLLAEAKPGSTDANRPDWLEQEEQRLARLQQAVAELHQIQELAPPQEQADFQAQYRLARDSLQAQRSLLKRYQEVKAYAQKGEQQAEVARRNLTTSAFPSAIQAYQQAATTYNTALTILASILQADPAQERAQQQARELKNLHQQIEEQQQDAYNQAEGLRLAEQGLAKIVTLLEQGNYADAVTLAEQFPNHSETLALLTVARAAKGLVEQVQANLDSVNQALNEGKLDEAAQLVEQVEAQLHPDKLPSLHNLAGEVRLLQSLEGLTVQFPKNLDSEVKRLSVRVRVMGQSYERISRCLANDDSLTALAELNRLKEQGYSETHQVQHWHAQIKQRLQNQLEDIQQKLTLKYNERWPTWFESTLSSHLSNVVNNLDILNRAQNLQPEAIIWRGKLLGFLNDFLTDRLEQAKPVASPDDRSRALAIIAPPWQAISKIFNVDLEVGPKIETFLTTLANCSQIEAKLARLSQQLTDYSLTFRDALNSVEQLTQANLPDDLQQDIQTWEAALRQALRIEQALAAIKPSSGAYAAFINERWRLAQELVELQKLPEHRRNELQQQLTQAISLGVTLLEQDLKRAIQALDIQSETDLQQLQSLYWQACWVQKIDIADSNLRDKLKQLPPKALALADKWQAEIARNLTHLQAWPDLSRIQQLLTGLINLVEGLTHPSVGPDGHPPTPRTSSDYSLPDQAELLQWQTTVTALQHLPDGPELVNPLQQLLADLTSTWMKLQLEPPWPETRLAQLAAETQTYLNLNKAIARAEFLTDPSQSIEGLACLYAQSDMLNRLEEFAASLLAPYWQDSKQRFDKLWQTLRAGLIDQVVGILLHADEKPATQQLNQILRNFPQTTQSRYYDEIIKALFEAGDCCEKKEKDARKVVRYWQILEPIIDAAETLSSLPENKQAQPGLIKRWMQKHTEDNS